ncbi:MAG: phosphoglucomutase, alpha-D-glucose phosphate-specific [Candidatus Margulisiibacteriota bacterium]
MATRSALAGTRPTKNELVPRREIQRRYAVRGYSITGIGISNGTSGHRGKVGEGFTFQQVSAMVQACAEIKNSPRGAWGPNALPEGQKPGPVIIGHDVRYASDLARDDAIEVLTGNGITVIEQTGRRAVPTPVVSHAILAANRKGRNAEGIIITASHNTAEEGGLKTNGLDGGPNVNTKPIDLAANTILAEDRKIKRKSIAAARAEGLLIEKDLIGEYVADLDGIINFDVIKSAEKRGMRFAATSLGGSAHGIYKLINRKWGLLIREHHAKPDPKGLLRTYDWDGKLRGDPSSADVMKAAEDKKGDAVLLAANDNDADRFGGIDSGGILLPNHVLAVLIDYLCQTRQYNRAAKIARTIGTTHMINCIAEAHGREVVETDVGFKWMVDGLADGSLMFACEESAGASFLRKDGTTWTTEKDGIAINLLMMEVIAATGKDISTFYRELEVKYGNFAYERIDAPATDTAKARLKSLIDQHKAARAANQPSPVEALLRDDTLVEGLTIKRIRIGDGIKVVFTGANGKEIWVLKRASGTEPIIKDYREQQGDGSLDIARAASEAIARTLGL